MSNELAYQVKIKNKLLAEKNKMIEKETNKD